MGGAAACERLVEAAGLKPVFGMFLKKVSSLPRMQKTEKRGKDAQEMFNILTLLLDEY
jgi:hypothetical protein